MSRLRAGAVVPLAWGALLAVQAAILFAFPSGLLVHLLNAGMVAAMLLLGVALLLRRAPREAMWALPDASVATVVVAAGMTAVVLGVELGTWLVLIGAGWTVLGLAGVVREVRAARGGGR